MKKLNPVAQTLLDFGLSLFDPDYAQARKVDSRAALRSLQQEFADLKLTTTDWKITAGLFAKHILGEKYLSTTDLLGGIFGDPQAILRHLTRVVRLLEEGILEAQELHGDKDRFSANLSLSRDGCGNVSFVLEDVLEMTLRLSPRMLRRFLGTAKSCGSTVQPYENNREYLRDWFQYLDYYREVKQRKSFGESASLRAAMKELKEWESRMMSRSSCTAEVFPLQDAIRTYGLDCVEQIILVYLLKEDLSGNSCSYDELLDLISEDKFDSRQKARYFEPGSCLVSNGLIEVLQTRMFNSFFGELKLGPGVSKRLLEEKSFSGVAQSVRDILGLSDLLKIEKPQGDFSKLILPESIKKMLITAMGQCCREVAETLRIWGISSASLSSGGEVSRQTSQLMLFYGHPGTGKTYAAGAIAKELGTDLLVTDISRLLSCWVGESEANVRRLFGLYEQIALRVENPPILLLNECDQFLTRRGFADHAADRMYNQMQNLFLEAFERFEGILIATTNLRDNLDPAFSRRFHLKLEFPLPDAESRLKLWRIHIPGTLPLTQDVNLPALAQEYALTGGQIAVIVKNAALEAAQSGDGTRGVSMELLRKYIQIELSSTFSGGPKHSWGFNLPTQQMKNREQYKEAI